MQRKHEPKLGGQHKTPSELKPKLNKTIDNKKTNLTTLRIFHYLESLTKNLRPINLEHGPNIKTITQLAWQWMRS